MRWILTMALCAPAAAHAQIDYRNLDDGRPTVTEDAYPVERYAFELLGGSRLQRAGGAWTHSAEWGVEYGLFPNTEVGFGFTMVDSDLGSGTVSALYNANTEGVWLPALAVRATAGFEGPQVAVKVIATRSFGRQRVHVNAGKTFGTVGTAAISDAFPREFASVAVDRTLFRQSTLLVAEVTARDAGATPLEVNAALGARWQWMPGTVLDIGVTRRLRDGGPDFGVTIGLSVVFGVPFLMPGAPR